MLREKALEYEIDDLQTLFDSSIFQAAGFELASDEETISLPRAE